MHRIKAMFATLALSGLALSIPATVSAQSSGNAPQQCAIQIKRNAQSGVFDVTRSVTRSGGCVCSVSTGPRDQGGSAESALAQLVLRKTCADAPLAPLASTGGLGTGTWIGLALLGGGGIAAALAAGGSSSP